MPKTRITKLGGQRYALYVDGQYYCSGSYDFVKGQREQVDPLRRLKKFSR